MLTPTLPLVCYVILGELLNLSIIKIIIILILWSCLKFEAKFINAQNKIEEESGNYNQLITRMPLLVH